MIEQTEDVFIQHPIGSNMIVCMNADNGSSVSVDVRADNALIEIDNGKDCRTSFDMSMSGAIEFFALVQDVIAPVKRGDAVVRISNRRGGTPQLQRSNHHIDEVEDVYLSEMVDLCGGD